MNTYHRIPEVKPIDVKSSTCIDFGRENNNTDSKLEVGNHVRKIIKKSFCKKLMWRSICD